MTPLRSARTLVPRREGTAAIELALMAPMLMILFAGVVDFARAYRQQIQLSAAVAAASHYALLNAANINSGGAVALAATLSGIVANANGTAWAGASVTVNAGATNSIVGGVPSAGGTPANANSCWCPTGTPGTWNWGAAVACGTACVGGSGTLAGKFVTIAGTRSFSPIFIGYGVIGDVTLRQTTIVQAQ